MNIFGIKIGKAPSISAKEVLGIDCGSNTLKIAQVRITPARTEVVSLFNRDISGMDDSAVSKVVSTYLQGLGVKRPYIVGAIASHSAITKNIEIPSLDVKEIKEIINLQAGRHTPYSRDEIVIDYINMGTHKSAYTKTLLVIVERNVIKRQFDMVTRAGFEMAEVLFAPESLALSCADILNINTSRSPVCVINIDETFTDFTIVYKSKLVFVRSIPIGAQHIIESKDVYNAAFAEEVKKSLETYQIENIEKYPESIVLTGAIGDINDMEQLLAGMLNIPVKITPYFNNLVLVNKTGLSNKISFLNIIASILALGGAKINLIPEEVRIKRSIEERGRELIKMGVLVFTIFILICTTLVSNIFFKTSYLKKLNAQYQSLGKEAGELENSFNLVSMVRNYIFRRGYSLEVLTELHDIAPINLELNEIRFDDEGKVSVKGTAESMAVVFSFAEAMGKSQYFKDVKTRYTSNRKEGSKDLTDFEIVSSLNKVRK